MSARCVRWAGPSGWCPRAAGRSPWVLWQSLAGLPVVQQSTLVMRCALCSVLQTLVIKVCGVILSVVGGLAVGKVMCTGRSWACCYLLRGSLALLAPQ